MEREILSRAANVPRSAAVAAATARLAAALAPRRDSGGAAAACGAPPPYVIDASTLDGTGAIARLELGVPGAVSDLPVRAGRALLAEAGAPPLRQARLTVAVPAIPPMMR
jgi:hypothetical protein